MAKRRDRMYQYPKGSYRRLLARPKGADWPHYDFNDRGEAIILPMERICRFEGCDHRTAFRHYHDLYMHVRDKHDVKISGPQRMWDKLLKDESLVEDWIVRVLMKGERGLPAPDVWSTWHYSLPDRVLAWYNYRDGESEEEEEEEEEEEPQIRTETTETEGNEDDSQETASTPPSTAVPGTPFRSEYPESPKDIKHSIEAHEGHFQATGAGQSPGPESDRERTIDPWI